MTLRRVAYALPLLVFALGGWGWVGPRRDLASPVPDPPSAATTRGSPGAAVAEPAAHEAATLATTDSTTTTTTIVVLRWGADRVELVRAVDKPGLPWAPAAGAGGARFVLEDAGTGARLAEGPCAVPRLCGCERGHDHLRGDVMVRHEAVVRLKLPRLAARERVRIETPGPAGWEELSSFLLEGRS